jgi:RNA-directed DNA polymerase
VDKGGDDETRAVAQRGENLGEECPNGTLRLSWLLAWATPSAERWPLVPGSKPVQEECAADQDQISALLTPGNKGAWPEVRKRLNRLLGGWSAYFSYGALASAYEAVDRHVYDRTRNFLCRRHKVQGRGTNRFSREHVYGELEVLCLRRERRRPPPWALR